MRKTKSRSSYTISVKLEDWGGGVRSFFLESKHFQLVLEGGGRYFMLQIFERGKFFMRSVFLGKNAAHWLMSNIEHIVVGVSPK